VVFAYGADLLKNPDQPIKGQWQFSPSKIWEQDKVKKGVRRIFSWWSLLED
jgi:hypothetical protein